MTRTKRVVLISIVLIVILGLAYWIYSDATAEKRMKATCAAINPGMPRSFGRHACKALLEKGVVKHSEHNYAD